MTAPPELEVIEPPQGWKAKLRSRWKLLLKRGKWVVAGLIAFELVKMILFFGFGAAILDGCTRKADAAETRSRAEMIAALPDPKWERYTSRQLVMPDGVRLNITEGGSGRPLLLLHGWLSNAEGNFIRTGFADAFVDAGYRVIMVDFRGHGKSERPQGAAFYSRDVLALDGLEVVRQLGLTDYDLMGYSIGARTAMRMVIDGARPRRTVLAGLGWTTIIELPENIDLYEAGMLGPVPAQDDVSTPALLRKLADMTGVDKAAAIHILRSTPPTSPEDLSAAFTMPTLLILGDADLGIGPPEPLHAAIAGSTLTRVGGDHMTVLLNPEMKAEIVAWLARS